MLVVLTTVSTIFHAESLADLIISSKLAACVQIIPKITSFFFWEGKLQKESEYLLLIKTLAENFDGLSAFIAQNHCYEVPEIIAIDAEKVSASYLKWMTDSLRII